MDRGEASKKKARRLAALDKDTLRAFYEEFLDAVVDEEGVLGSILLCTAFVASCCAPAGR